jgi:hypothetical protein
MSLQGSPWLTPGSTSGGGGDLGAVDHGAVDGGELAGQAGGEAGEVGAEEEAVDRVVLGDDAEERAGLELRADDLLELWFAAGALVDRRVAGRVLDDLRGEGEEAGDDRVDVGVGEVGAGVLARAEGVAEELEEVAVVLRWRCRGRRGPTSCPCSRR